MLISNGSGRDGFQRTYKNNGSGVAAKLNVLFYFGNPLRFFPLVLEQHVDGESREGLPQNVATSYLELLQKCS